MEVIPGLKSVTSPGGGAITGVVAESILNVSSYPVPPFLLKCRGDDGTVWGVEKNIFQGEHRAYLIPRSGNVKARRQVPPS